MKNVVEILRNLLTGVFDLKYCGSFIAFSCVVFFPNLDLKAQVGPCDVGSGVFFSNVNTITAIGVCEPVVLSDTEWTLSIPRAFVEANGFSLRFRVNWGDGSEQFVAGGDIIEDGLQSDTGSPGDLYRYRISPNHTFPVSRSRSDPCQYTVKVHAVINGQECLTANNYVVKNYAKENVKGQLDLNIGRGGSTPLEICPGTQLDFTPSDVSDLDCTGQGEGNISSRWVRIKYVSTIPDLVVGGTAMTVGTPYYSQGNGVPFSTTDNVIYLANLSSGTTDYTDGTGTDFTGHITTSATNRQQTGQTLTITLEYWNICNPFASVFTPNVPLGLHSPESTELVLTVSLAPNSPNPIPNEICYGANGGLFEININGFTGANTFYWYSVDPQSSMGVTPFKSTSNTGNTSGVYSSDYVGVNSIPINGIETSLGGNQGAVYTMWATQKGTAQGSNLECESLPIATTLTVKPKLDESSIPAITGPTTTPPDSFCHGDNNQTFTIVNCSPGETIPVNNFTNTSIINFNTEYAWNFSTSNGSISNIVDCRTANASFTNRSSHVMTTNIQVRKQYSNNGGCQSDVKEKTISVYPASNGGVITRTGNAVECLSSVVHLTLRNYIGDVISWEQNFRSATGTYSGTWTTISTTTATYSTPPLNSFGFYKYRAIVKSGVCSQVYSSEIEFQVIDAPVGSIQSDLDEFCTSGTPNFTSNGTSSGGTGVFTYQWQSSDTGLDPWINITSEINETYTPNTPVTSTTYFRRQINSGTGNCASNYSNTIKIEVYDNPSLSTVAGGGSICVDGNGNSIAPADIEFYFAGRERYNFMIQFTPAGGGASSNIGPFTTGAGESKYIYSPLVTNGAGEYEISSLTDSVSSNGTNTSASCSATAADLTTKAFVTSGGVLANFDSNGLPALTPSVVCKNYVQDTENPRLMFVLQNANSQSNMSLKYDIDGAPSTIRTKNFNTTNTGSPTNIISFDDVELNMVGTHTINFLNISASGGCKTDLNNSSVTFTVNGAPAPPTGAVDATWCSANGPSVIKVDMPTVPFTTIDWYDVVNGGNPVSTGTTGSVAVPGPPLIPAVPQVANFEYTPVSTSIENFYAETRDNNGCVSTSRTLVKSIKDQLPSSANAGGSGSANPIQLCSVNSLTYDLNAVPANNNGTGIWSAFEQDAQTGTFIPNNTITFANNNLRPNARAGNFPDVIGTSKIFALVWTVNSEFQVCLPTTDTVQLEIRPLPIPNQVNLRKEICTNEADTYSLLQLNGEISNNISGVTISWFGSQNNRQNATNVLITPQRINDRDIFYASITDNITSCATNGQLVFFVNPLPIVVAQSRSLCEDFPLPALQTDPGHVTLNLVDDYNSNVSNGESNRAVEWFTSNSIVPTTGLFDRSNFIGNPDSYLATEDASQQVVLYAVVTETVTTTRCQNSTTLTLEVKPRPYEPIVSSTSLTTDSICSEEILTINLQSNLVTGVNDITTFSWIVVDNGITDNNGNALIAGSAGVPAGSSTYAFSSSLKNSTGAIESVKYSFKPTFNGCDGVITDTTIVVNMLPTAISLNPVICDQASTNYDLTSHNDEVTNSVTGVTVDWYSDSGLGNLINPPTQQTFSHGAIFYPKVTDALTGCTQNSIVTFTVNSRATVTAQSIEKCEDFSPTIPIPSNQLTFDLTSYDSPISANEPNANVTWYSDVATTNQINNPTSYTATGDANGNTSVYAIVANTITGCQNISQLDVFIKPRPPATNLVSPDTQNTPAPPSAICSNSEFTVFLTTGLAGSAMDMTEFSWVVSNDAGINLSGGSNLSGSIDGRNNSAIRQTLRNMGDKTVKVDYLVTPHFNSCTGKPSTISVLVYPIIRAVANVEDPSTGLFAPAPEPINICYPNPLNVNFTSSVESRVPGIVDTPVTYDWSVTDANGIFPVGTALSGTGNLRQALDNTTLGLGILYYTVTPKVPASSCIGQEIMFSVKVSPKLQATVLNTPEPAPYTGSYICKGRNIDLRFSVSGVSPIVFDYNSQEFSIGPDGSTVREINTLTAGNMVNGNLYSMSVSPDFSTIYSITRIRDALGCEIDFTVPPNSPTNYNVNVGNPDARFTVNDHVNSTDPGYIYLGGCSPFSPTIRYNHVDSVIYTWHFNVIDSTYMGLCPEIADCGERYGHNIPNRPFKHIFENGSDQGNLFYQLSMTARLDYPYPGCINGSPPAGTKTEPEDRFTPVQTINVKQSVNVNIQGNPDEICSGRDITNFTNSSRGVNIESFYFREKGSSNWGNPFKTKSGGADAAFDYTFTNPSSKNPSPSVINNPLKIEIRYLAETTNGCPSDEVYFDYDIDDPGAVVPNPDPIHHRPILKVYPSVVPEFVWSPDPVYYSNGSASVTFTNESSTLDDNIFQYDWYFGKDAVPSTFRGMIPPIVTFLSSGTKYISLTVTNIGVRNPCLYEIEKPIVIDVPELFVEFSVRTEQICLPAKIEVFNSNITGDIWEYKLYLGSNVSGVSNLKNPTFNVASDGVYTLTLRAKNSILNPNPNDGWKSATPRSIYVYPKPEASFVLRSPVVYIPDTQLEVSNLSVGASYFLWDFGEGNESDETEPKYKYTIEGNYTITLTAYGDYGNNIICSSRTSKQVQAKLGGVARVPNAFTPSLNGPRKVSGTQGSSNVGDQTNDVFLPFVKGSEEYSLQIYDRWGNLIFESNNSSMGWDGYNEGKLMQAGVYVFRLSIKLSNGQRTTQIGDITLIR